MLLDAEGQDLGDAADELVLLVPAVVLLVLAVTGLRRRNQRLPPPGPAHKDPTATCG